MGIALGLAAALGFGTADFLARYATRSVGTYRALLFMELVGMVAVSLYVLPAGVLQHTAAKTSWQPWAWGIVVSLLGTVSTLALYRSYETGIISIVAPIAASFAAITVVLSFLSGERVSGLRAVGIVVTLLGVILASYVPMGGKHNPEAGDRRRLEVGVGWALAAAVGFGVAFWLLGFQVTPKLGSVVPVWLTRVTTPLVLVLAARPLGQSISLPRGPVWRLLIAMGLLDSLGYLAAAQGMLGGQVGVVSVLISLFSVVTVVLAWIFLDEKLHRSQWLGIVLIFAGVTLVNVHS
jgi:drug/metabolite transporter (DMT)-like permease